ncbi:ROK family protein [Lactobacillus selangorensis]|uniref:ROK family protein n=1 Tax=Lactobacillus selangorensis TaxID=81857 RepID=A0A0R2FTC3_9LACO|nr:ROK family protein [Lactobacillus selangorensis]KRN27972.1 ROK family protein [Lactobacillus selangorensis]KRN30557.1 ROK family protein [Lactobacillus selangorensis]
MAKIGVIDVGGTSIKYGVWTGEKVIKQHSLPTPKRLDKYYQQLTAEVDQMKADDQIVGVGISTPGAVNKETGVIEGASAIPYIHNFPIQPELVKRFGLPVTLENDANSAALAEMIDGAGADVQNALFLVLGTGVGGAVIINGHVFHGAHLFGGEFGYMQMGDGQILSEVATPVGVARHYNERTGKAATGEDVFNLAKQGDLVAAEEVEHFYKNLARAIYNLQYGFDPQRIILGGAVSQNPDLLPNVKREMQAILKQVDIAPFMPDVVTCRYHNEANLRGAAVDFMQTYPDK